MNGYCFWINRWFPLKPMPPSFGQRFHWRRATRECNPHEYNAFKQVIYVSIYIWRLAMRWRFDVALDFACMNRHQFSTSTTTLIILSLFIAFPGIELQNFNSAVKILALRLLLTALKVKPKGNKKKSEIYIWKKRKDDFVHFNW